MSYLNLMGNKLKAREVNDALTELDALSPETPTTNVNASNVNYDNSTSHLSATNAQTAIDEVLSKLLSNLFLTNIVRFTVQLTDTNLIFIAMTNIENSDGIHVYFSTTNTKKITVYKRESGVTTELYSFT